MVPSAAVSGAHAERATTYLAPSSPQRPGGAGTGVVTAPDATVEVASRADLAGDTAERTRVRLVQSSSAQAALDRYAGEVPPYVNAAPLALVGRAFDHPVAGPFTLSSAFGWRKNPTHVGPAAQFHIGLDYAVACGTPVLAAADGTVASAGERGTGGLRVDIDHGDGLVTSYRHNSRLLVSPGDRVGRGDAISLSGTTGNSTGCHLHFDTTLDGLYVDPVQLLPEVAGQPRALDAVDLERIRAAAREEAPSVAPERREASPRSGQPAVQGPIAREAAPRTGPRGDHGRAPEAPAAQDPSPRPPPPGRPGRLPRPAHPPPRPRRRPPEARRQRRRGRPRETRSPRAPRNRCNRGPHRRQSPRSRSPPCRGPPPPRCRRNPPSRPVPDRTCRPRRPRRRRRRRRRPSPPRPGPPSPRRPSPPRPGPPSPRRLRRRPSPSHPNRRRRRPSPSHPRRPRRRPNPSHPRRLRRRPSPPHRNRRCRPAPRLPPR
ncbi:M23 family metallopeptidase [Citricoccus sp. CH26A]|uniref:M23 family metallopeptidase n=1 Tax=Citricoccus sp. CH26A TaxID=1045009 RepID=UPI00350FF8F7